jgi:hypothetical protein
MGVLSHGTQQHHAETCRDDDCTRLPCRMYKAGFRDGYEQGREEGFAEGFAAGYSEGYSAGYGAGASSSGR